MRKFGTLLKLNLKAMLTSFRFGGGKKKRAVSAIGAMALLAVLALYLSGTYSFLMVSQLAPIGMEELVILVMPVMALVMGAMFSIFAAQGVIFSGKDNDLMFSMPVSAFTLMLSRTLALYVENLIFTIFIMIPAGAAYLLGGGSGGAMFFVAVVVCALLLSLLPTLLSLIVGFLVAWVSSKFARRGILATVLYMAAFLAFMVLVMRLSYSMNSLAEYAAGIPSAFDGWGLPFLLTMRACCRGEWLALLELAALCIIPFLLLVWLFARRYKAIVTALASKAVRSDYRLEKLRTSSCRSALLKKEAKRLFSSPVFFLNAMVGLIMTVALSIAAVFFRGTIGEFMAAMYSMMPDFPIAAVLTAAVALMVSMTTTTAVTISLEGQQLWILKTAPISAKGIFGVKIAFQMLLVIPCVLLSTVGLAVAFSLGAAEAALMLMAALAMGLCMAVMGLFINLCMPRLDAPNIAVVVKQSGSVIVTMLAGLGLTAAGVGLYVLTQRTLGPTLAILPALVLCLALAGVFGALLSKRGPQMFLDL